MLVLTRKLMEKLFIGDDICVTVVRLEGGQVRLGIEAPREVAVVRAELVPERDQAHRASRRAPVRPGPPSADRPAPAPPPAQAAPPAQASVPPTPAGGARVRIPQASAHGTDSRRRGPSQ